MNTRRSFSHHFLADCRLRMYWCNDSVCSFILFIFSDDGLVKCDFLGNFSSETIGIKLRELLLEPPAVVIAVFD